MCIFFCSYAIKQNFCSSQLNFVLSDKASEPNKAIDYTKLSLCVCWLSNPSFSSSSSHKLFQSPHEFPHTKNSAQRFKRFACWLSSRAVEVIMKIKIYLFFFVIVTREKLFYFKNQQELNFFFLIFSLEKSFL